MITAQRVDAAGSGRRLRQEEAAAMLGKSVFTLAKWRKRGVGPRFLRIGASIEYPVAEIESWLASRVFQSTDESRAADVGVACR